MKCSKQPCICHANHYKLLFKGFGLLYLYGVQCKMCLKQYPVKCILKHMSLTYVDVLLKVVLLLSAIYYLILGFLPGIAYMFSLIILINFFIYPLLFKMKIIVIDRKKE